MSLVDRRPPCERCGRQHWCRCCEDAVDENKLIEDVTRAARLEIVEWIESEAKDRTSIVRATLVLVAEAIRKEFDL